MHRDPAAACAPPRPAFLPRSRRWETRDAACWGPGRVGALGGLPRVGAERGFNFPSSGPGSSDWPQVIGLPLSLPPARPTRWGIGAPGREGAGRRRALGSGGPRGARAEAGSGARSAREAGE